MDTLKSISVKIPSLTVPNLSVSIKPQAKNENVNTEIVKNDSLTIQGKNTDKPSNVKRIEGVSIKLYDSAIIKSKEDKPQVIVNTVTNGVFNTSEDAEKTLNKIKNITGQEDTSLIYNPTYGVFDGIEATVQLLDIPGSKQVARLLNHLSANSENNIKLMQSPNEIAKQVIQVAFSGEKTIDQEVADKIYPLIKSGAGINTVVHSQGAAIWADALNIVRNRLLEETNDLSEVDRKMSNVKIVTIGGYSARCDFPTEVQLLEIKNDLHSKEGLDPISFIASHDSPRAFNVGDLKFKSKAVQMEIAKDPNRSNLEKGFLKHTINMAVAGRVTIAKTERAIAAVTQATAALIITTPLNSIKNKGILKEHIADGYVSNSDISKAIQNFFKK